MNKIKRLKIEKHLPLLHQINRPAEEGGLVFNTEKPIPLEIGIYHKAKKLLIERGVEFKSHQLNHQLKLYVNSYSYLKSAAFSRQRITLEGNLIPRTKEDIVKAKQNFYNEKAKSQKKPKYRPKKTGQFKGRGKPQLKEKAA